MSLKIATNQVGDVTVMTLNGRLVFGEEAIAFKKAVNSLKDAGPKNLVLNVEKVTFVDSAGLGALLAANHSTSSRGGKMRLCQPQPTFTKLLKITHLHTVFEVSETEADAISSLAG